MTLLAKFNCNPPATTAALQQVEDDNGFALPKEYAQFLLQANGGEGFIGRHAYVILWRVEELSSMNKAYEVAEYAPGLFIFGSNGGGEAFAFDMRSDRREIVEVPFVGMDLSLIRECGANFNDFLERLSKS